MKSKLVIVPVEKLQSKIVSTLRSLSGVGIYVALDKNPKRIREILKKKKINTNNLFFIDCVGSDSPEKEIIQIKPTKLNEIDYAVKSFIANIKGKKFLMTDSLSTLLIYNDENAYYLNFLERGQGRNKMHKGFISIDTVNDIFQETYQYLLTGETSYSALRRP